jgi:WD40 repeat protein
VTAVAITPDARILASGSSTGEVKIWDVRTGQELLGFQRHTGPVNVVEFSPDGRTLLTASPSRDGKGEVAIWRTQK